MANNGPGRGGGYDAFIDQQSQKRKAFGSASRQEQSVGAQATPINSASDLQAPSSLGDLMTPSAGRMQQSAAPEDFNKRVNTNRQFLESPEAKGMMMQFAMTMLSGGNPGQALARAIAMPGRMELAREKADEKAAKLENQEERLLIAQERLGMAQDTFEMTKEKQAARQEVFGALGSMSDEKLMEAATELAGKGDYEGARVALSMRKEMSGESDALLRHYQLAQQQGYTGTLMQFQQDSYSVSALEGIRRKIIGGIPLTPGEQKLYDDSLKGDPLIRKLTEDIDLNLSNATPGGPMTSVPDPASSGQSGKSGNVSFKVVE